MTVYKLNQLDIKVILMEMRSNVVHLGARRLNFLKPIFGETKLNRLFISDSNKVPKEALGPIRSFRKNKKRKMLWHEYTDKDNDGKYK